MQIEAILSFDLTSVQWTRSIKQMIAQTREDLERGNTCSLLINIQTGKATMDIIVHQKDENRSSKRSNYAIFWYITKGLYL